MDMKINLDQIFGLSNKLPEQLQDTTQDFIDAQEPSQDLSFDYNYKLKRDIFDSSSHVPSDNYTHKQNPTSSNKSYFTETAVFPEGTLPGTRLYYESVHNSNRKKQQFIRIKEQKLMQERKQITFKPQINQKSQKLATAYKNNENCQKKKKKVEVAIVGSRERRQLEEEAECTFQPKLIAKNLIKKQKSGKNDIFHSLFNECKVKKIKEKLKAEENEEMKVKSKKMSKDDIDKFLERNQEYMNKVQKKTELLHNASNKYDLETGNKLFSPRKSTKSFHPKDKKSKLDRNKSNHQSKVPSIFNKHQQAISVQQNQHLNVFELMKMRNQNVNPIFGDTDQPKEQTVQFKIADATEQHEDSEGNEDEGSEDDNELEEVDQEDENDIELEEFKFEKVENEGEANKEIN